MTIQFYKIADVANKINKRIPDTPALTIQGTLKDRCSMLDPVITIENSSVPDYNYAYIPEFNRYYFITEITSVRNNLWRISLKVDVLESFKTDILNLNCIVDKQQNQSYSNNIDDGSYINKADSFIEIANYQNGFNSSGEFILSYNADGEKINLPVIIKPF